MAEIGRTGLAEFAGQIQEDFLRELRGKEAYKRYDEMRRNSPIISAMLMAYEQAIRKVDWNFTCDNENDPRIEFLNEARDGMSHSWNDHITEALTMLPFGYSIFEIIYQRIGGKVYWRKFATRGQDTVYQWRFDDDGGLAGFIQMAAPSYKTVFIPIEKTILYRIRVEKNNPEGRSILRSAWIPYYYTKHIQQIEAIGIERDLAGLPLIRLPEGADTSTNSNSDLNKAQEVVRNVRNDEQAGITLPPGWEFELVSTGGSRQFDTDKIVRRYESRMLMSALSQFLMLGQESVGSLALSKDQTDFFNITTNAVADIIAETFTKYAIPRLLKLNGMDSDGIRLEHTPAGDVDTTMLMDALQKAGGLLTWDAVDEVWLRGLLGLPEKDAEILQAERYEADARREEIAQKIKAQVEKPDEDTKDEMSMDYFTTPAPDNNKRLKFERDIRKKVAKVLKRQKNKVLTVAKGLIRG
jgi:hypothetical protein